jgi:hypothetical protein
MSTLQHTSQLREHATRRLVLIAVVALIVAGGIAAGIVAIASGGNSAAVNSSPVVNAQPMYMSGALEHGVQLAKAAQSGEAASQNASGDEVPTPQTPGARP